MVDFLHLTGPPARTAPRGLAPFFLRVFAQPILGAPHSAVKFKVFFQTIECRAFVCKEQNPAGTTRFFRFVRFFQFCLAKYPGCLLNCRLSMVNCRTPPKSQSLALQGTPKRGMTLLEVTIVISVMLGLLSGLMIAARAWKGGTDRATCILNIRNAQLAGRSYQNMRALSAGQPFDPNTIIGEEKALPAMPTCPAGGEYSFVDEFPPVGTLFMSCSLSAHTPQDSSSW